MVLFLLVVVVLELALPQVDRVALMVLLVVEGMSQMDMGQFQGQDLKTE
jgi:hypothetical protein